MSEKNLLSEKNRSILPEHNNVQMIHQKLLEHHFKKPDLALLESKETDQYGLPTPNQQYKKQLNELLEKYK